MSGQLSELGINLTPSRLFCLISNAHSNWRCKCGTPLWGLVGSLFGVGSLEARRLCLIAGLDPDQSAGSKQLRPGGAA